MTGEKKLILKRLVIFFAIAFIPLCVTVIVINKVMGGLIFDGENAESPATQLIGLIGMLFPAIASILTRIITKEGFGETYLRANFKGNMKYYGLSIAIPVIYGLASAIAARSIYGAPDSSEFSTVGGVALVFIQIGSAIVGAFYALGEELGWRGYMMPKLEKLFGTPVSIIVGGVIWGLWHAPITCSGHNFGTDYKGFPYVGIGLMCIMCIFMNSILTYVTKKTKSVYPASILHMVNNCVPGVIIMLLASQKTEGIIAPMLISFIPMGIIAVAMFMLLINQKEKAA